MLTTFDDLRGLVATQAFLSTCTLLDEVSGKEKQASPPEAYDAAIELLKQTVAETDFDGKVYLVGGIVRDQEMGKPVNDIDVVVDGDLDAGIKAAELIARKLGIYKAGSNPVIFPNYGTAKIHLHGVKHGGFDLSEIDVEFVAPRVESYQRGSRKPSVTKGKLQDDADRRDFTVNTLMRNLTSGELLDLTGFGVEDLKKRVIRTPLNPDKTFSDDALRMLRAVRFAVKYQFDLPMFMIRAIKKNAHRIHSISAERVQEELDKMLQVPGVKPSQAIKLMRVTGLLKEVLPELQALHGLSQNAFHDRDALGHTLGVLDKTPPELIRRLAALFHDVGKAATKTVDPATGKVQFLGHQDVGAELAHKILKRLRYSNDIINQVKTIIRLHMKTKDAHDDSLGMSDKKLRMLVNRAGTLLEPLLDVIHADNSSVARDHCTPNQVAAIRERIKDWDLDRLIDPDKHIPLDGNDIRDLGAQGPLIGQIKARIRDKWIEKDGKLDKATAIGIAQNMIRDNRKEEKK